MERLQPMILQIILIQFSDLREMMDNIISRTSKYLNFIYFIQIFFNMYSSFTPDGTVFVKFRLVQ